MTDPTDRPFPASVLGRQLRIPHLFLKRADQAMDARSWATEFAALRPRAAASIAVPTRHGATLVEIHEGYEALRASSKGLTPARLIAASTKMGNPIVWSLARGGLEYEDMSENEVFPSETSEPLATHKAKQGKEAIAAVRATMGWGFAAGDEELENLAKQLLRTEDVDVAPASTAGIAALHFAAKLGRLEEDAPHVAIVYARSQKRSENGGAADSAGRRKEN